MKTLRLYVVEFSNGLIKAGITTSFSRRALALERIGAITRHFVSTPVSGFAAESALLVRLKSIGNLYRGAEVFADVGFTVAVNLCRQAASRAWSASVPRSRNRVTRPCAANVAPIRCGRIGIAQADADHVTLLHYGKSGITSAIVSSAQLERWALRQLRETVFAAPEAAIPAEQGAA